MNLPYNLGKGILLLPTKTSWRNNSDIKLIESQLDQLASGSDTFKKHLKSLAIPKLECGLGNLSWDKVKPLIIEKLSKLSEELTIEIWE